MSNRSGFLLLASAILLAVSGFSLYMAESLKDRGCDGSCCEEPTVGFQGWDVKPPGRYTFACGCESVGRMLFAKCPIHGKPVEDKAKAQP